MSSSSRAIAIAPAPWEQRLHLIRNVAIALTIVAIVVAYVTTRLEPWTWSSAGQRGAELWFHGLLYLVPSTIVLVGADLLVRSVRRR